MLEGDQSSRLPVGGPGQRYALGPVAPVEKLEAEGELPESYGTRQLLLTARDPHWLYAHWDLGRQEQLGLNAQSRDGHLVLRVHLGSADGPVASEVHVHPESRHWFIHVDRAGAKYAAELGFYSTGGDWKTICGSPATLSPPDQPSRDASAEFTAVPLELPMAKLFSLVKEAVRENAPLAEAFRDSGGQGRPDEPQPAAVVDPAGWSPGPAASESPTWTPEQERALAQLISVDQMQRVWMGSLEITEVIRRQMAGEVPGPETLKISAGAPTSPGGAFAAVSSPGAPAGRRARRFWLNVNAELIIYGSTEPDATVTLAGRQIPLRADGSFSCRFALPDGRYELPIVAEAADRAEGRAASMKFSRATDYHGQVGSAPAEAALKPPRTETIG